MGDLQDAYRAVSLSSSLSLCPRVLLVSLSLSIPVLLLFSLLQVGWRKKPTTDLTSAHMRLFSSLSPSRPGQPPPGPRILYSGGGASLPVALPRPPVPPGICLSPLWLASRPALVPAPGLAPPLSVSVSRSSTPQPPPWALLYSPHHPGTGSGQLSNISVGERSHVCQARFLDQGVGTTVGPGLSDSCTSRNGARHKPDSCRIRSTRLIAFFISSVCSAGGVKDWSGGRTVYT